MHIDVHNKNLYILIVDDNQVYTYVTCYIC